MSAGKNDLYEPIWIKLEDISNLLLYPLEIKDWLLEDIKTNFLNTPKVLKIDSKDLRKI